MSSELRPLQCACDFSRCVAAARDFVDPRSRWIPGQTTGEFEQDALWRRYSIADFVIVDGREISKPTRRHVCPRVGQSALPNFPYDPTKHTDFAAWYAAGAHDALRIPVSRGELLARVRTGATIPGIRAAVAASIIARARARHAFAARLPAQAAKLAAGDDLGTSQHTLLMTSIDWYDGIRKRSGETATRNLVNTAARAIKRVSGENSVSAYFGKGRFATLLQDNLSQRRKA